MKLIKTYLEWGNLFEKTTTQTNANGVLMIRSSTDQTKVLKEQSLNYTGLKEGGNQKSSSEGLYEIIPKKGLLKDLFSLSRDENATMGKYMTIKQIGKVMPGEDKLVIGDKSILNKGTIVLKKSDLEIPNLKIVASGNGLLVLARISGSFRNSKEQLTDLNSVGDYAVSFNMGGKDRGAEFNYLRPDANSEYFNTKCHWIVWRLCLAIFYQNKELSKLINKKDEQWPIVLNNKLFQSDPIKFISDELRNELGKDNYRVETNQDLTQVNADFLEFNKNLKNYLIYKGGYQVTVAGSKLFTNICNGILKSIIPSTIPPNFVGAESVFESYKRSLFRCFDRAIFLGHNINQSFYEIQQVMNWRPVVGTGLIAKTDVKNDPGKY